MWDTERGDASVQSNPSAMESAWRGNQFQKTSGYTQLMEATRLNALHSQVLDGNITPANISVFWDMLSAISNSSTQSTLSQWIQSVERQSGVVRRNWILNTPHDEQILCTLFTFSYIAHLCRNIMERRGVVDWVMSRFEWKVERVYQLLDPDWRMSEIPSWMFSIDRNCTLH